jgi:cation diffusion facilitator family transporter
VVALLVFGESMVRFVAPHPIRFGEAILVAVLGLGVNLLSAWLLAEEDPGHGGHSHGGHSHGHGHGHHQDHNLRAAYLHVLADALTSVLAIAALVAGKYWGWLWMDPAMGLVGAVLIASWSFGLMRDTSQVLLDSEDHGLKLRAIQEVVEGQDDDQISDLHLFRVGPRGLAAIVSVVTHSSRLPSDYKERFMRHSELSKLLHITVEVNRVDAT